MYRSWLSEATEERDCGRANSLKDANRYRVSPTEPIDDVELKRALREILSGTAKLVERGPQAVLIDLCVREGDAKAEYIQAWLSESYGGSFRIDMQEGTRIRFAWSGGDVGPFLRDVERGDLPTRLASPDSGVLYVDEVRHGRESVFTYVPEVTIPEKFDLEEATYRSVKDFLNGTNVLLLVATDLELRTALSAMKPAEGYAKILQVIHMSRVYYLGRLGNYQVALTNCTMGTGGVQGSLITSLRAIEEIRPRAVIMVGIAFGVDRCMQQLGDVIAAESIIPYELARIGERKVPRGRTIDCDKTLSNLVRSGMVTWRMHAGLRSLKIQQGLVLSGEKLVANREFRDTLVAEFPSAKGGEMEGAGVYWAAVEANVPVILVKGICDWADSLKNDRAQPFAATAAVSLTSHLLSKPDALLGLKIKSMVG